MQNDNVFPVLCCFFFFHIQMFSFPLVYSIKGLLTCNSCSTQLSSDLAVVYNTLNESQFLFFFHFSQSDQFICMLRHLQIRSIGNNISARANDLIFFQSKTTFWLEKTATFGNDREAELMQSGSHFCLKFPWEYATLLPLPPLGSIIQSAKPLCCKILHVAPNKTQLMSIKVQKKRGIKGLNTIRWQTCPLMRNGSLELASTTDEVHMVFWGLELCSPKSTLAMSDELNWQRCTYLKD